MRTVRAAGPRVPPRRRAARRRRARPETHCRGTAARYTYRYRDPRDLSLSYCNHRGRIHRVVVRANKT